MKKIILFAVIFLLGQHTMASENGGYAGSFLRIGLGARAMALGNTGVAARTDGYSFYYNPALAGLAEEKIAALSYSFLSLDRRFNFIGYTMKVPPGAGFSIGWINSGVDNITSYNLIGEESGSVDHSINAAFFSFARSFTQKFSVGLTIKYLWENLSFTSDKYEARGWGWDFGVYFKPVPALVVAAAVRDVGSKLKANTDKLFDQGGTTIDRFPQVYVLGMRYQTPLDWLQASYDLEASNKGNYVNHLGLEATYRDQLALRAGINGTSFAAGAGMGFTVGRFLTKLDYAFIPSVIDEGSSHVFSWQIYFK